MLNTKTQKPTYWIELSSILKEKISPLTSSLVSLNLFKFTPVIYSALRKIELSRILKKDFTLNV